MGSSVSAVVSLSSITVVSREERVIESGPWGTLLTHHLKHSSLGFQCWVMLCMCVNEPNHLIHRISAFVECC